MQELNIYTKGRLLILVILFFVSSAVMMLVLAPSTQAAAGVPPLDIRFTYTVDDVAYFFGALGRDGLLAYRAMWVLDMVYPLIYGLCAMMVMLALQRRLFARTSQANWVAAVPIIATLFDYLENIVLFILSLSPQTIDSSLARLASEFTTAKWLTLGVVAALLLTEAVAYVVLWSRERHQ